MEAEPPSQKSPDAAHRAPEEVRRHELAPLSADCSSRDLPRETPLAHLPSHEQRWAWESAMVQSQAAVQPLRRATNRRAASRSQPVSRYLPPALTESMKTMSKAAPHPGLAQRTLAAPGSLAAGSHRRPARKHPPGSDGPSETQSALWV